MTNSGEGFSGRVFRFIRKLDAYFSPAELFIATT